MLTASRRYGDVAVANNFLEQCDFHAERISITSDTTGPPYTTVTVGSHYEPANPRDVAILAELEEDHGQARKSGLDAILDVPAGRLVVLGVYQPEEQPAEDETEVPVTSAGMAHLHPTVREIIRGWQGW